MSKKYEGLNYVDAVVTPSETQKAPAKKSETKIKVPAVLIIMGVLCFVVFGIWLGRSFDIPFFYEAGYYVRRAISFDVIPSDMRGEGDGKLQLIADILGDRQLI